MPGHEKQGRKQEKGLWGGPGIGAGGLGQMLLLPWPGLASDHRVAEHHPSLGGEGG